MTPPSGDVTRLLSAWSGGDRQVTDAVMRLVYDELHRIARYHWNGQPQGHTLQPTALINEAFLKLVGHDGIHNRIHFFALASTAMRQILVNHAETSLAQKRGGGAVKVPLDERTAAIQREARETLALNDALNALRDLDPRKCQVVELRYFAGLSIEETAEALGVSTKTVTREWQTARAWLARELGGPVGL